VIAYLGHRQRVPEIARAMLEDELHLAAMEIVVEVGRDRELGALALERGESEAQVRHDPEISYDRCERATRVTPAGGMFSLRTARTG